MCLFFALRKKKTGHLVKGKAVELVYTILYGRLLREVPFLERIFGSNLALRFKNPFARQIGGNIESCTGHQLIFETK